MIGASYSASLLVASNSQLVVWGMMSPYSDFSMIPRTIPLRFENPSVKSVHLPVVSSFWIPLLSNYTLSCRSSQKSATKSTIACDFTVDLGLYLISYVLSFTCILCVSK